MKKLLCFLCSYIFSISVFANDIRFVQIDSLRYSKENNSAVLNSLIKDVNSLNNVDFIVFTGDNIQAPNEKELKYFLKTAKKLKRPFYVIIGDKEVNKHKNLSKKQYAGILKKNLRNYRHSDTNYMFSKNGVVFFVVDGSRDVIPGSNGYYKDDVLEWLDANLDLYSKKNVVILQHFPLISLENNEHNATFKPEKYLEILSKHNNVKAVISGHYNINKEVVINEIQHITTAPAPNYRIIDILNSDTNNPTIWAEVKNIN